jgi:DNA-directed RNA polymerase subunit K/omega
MDRTKIMDLSEKVGGLFRLAVLLQKRVQELVAGAPKLIQTNEINPINIAILEIEADAIELVDLSEQELAQLEAQSQMASDEAELLEALRTRMSANLGSIEAATPDKGGSESDDSDE